MGVTRRFPRDLADWEFVEQLSPFLTRWKPIRFRDGTEVPPDYDFDITFCSGCQVDDNGFVLLPHLLGCLAFPDFPDLTGTGHSSTISVEKELHA